MATKRGGRARARAPVLGCAAALERVARVWSTRPDAVAESIRPFPPVILSRGIAGLKTVVIAGRGRAVVKQAGPVHD